LTNEHNVPNISSCLLKFVHNVCKLTSVKVHHIETDFSWALIQSVLFSFNKENVDTYLHRAHTICHYRLQKKDLMRFTVVHICAAQMVNTISNAVSKVTKDKGCTKGCTTLQNSTSLEQAKSIFLQMCFVFLAENKHKLKTYIKQNGLDVEDDICLKACIPAEDDVPMSKNTIIGCIW